MGAGVSPEWQSEYNPGFTEQLATVPVSHCSCLCCCCRTLLPMHGNPVRLLAVPRAVYPGHARSPHRAAGCHTASGIHITYESTKMPSAGQPSAVGSVPTPIMHLNGWPAHDSLSKTTQRPAFWPSDAIAETTSLMHLDINGELCIPLYHPRSPLGVI